MCSPISLWPALLYVCVSDLAVTHTVIPLGECWMRFLGYCIVLSKLLRIKTLWMPNWWVGSGACAVHLHVVATSWWSAVTAVSGSHKWFCESGDKSGLGMRLRAGRKRRKRKRNPGLSKFSYLPAGYVRLPLRSVYSENVLYSALCSLLSPVFCVVWNFASIPMYRENETPYAIPT